MPGDRKIDALRLNKGDDAVTPLINAVAPFHLGWISSLQFGFAELDCGLIHRSSKDVGETLTMPTPPLTLLDRITRLNGNRLFITRS